MKMTPEHYQHLRDAITPLDTPEHRSAYAAKGYTAKRYRWDLMYAARLSQWACDNLYSYLNDDHIDTALKRIVLDNIKESDRAKI